MGRSEEKTDWLGDKYTVHYDDAGKIIGKSQEATDFLGGSYTVHTDAAGRSMGKSHESSDWLGDKHSLHYDDSGKETGRSRETTGLLGESYTVHTDAAGNRTGESHKASDWFGGTYIKHSGSPPYIKQPSRSAIPSERYPDDFSDSLTYSDEASSSSTAWHGSNSGNSTTTKSNSVEIGWVILGGIIILALIWIANRDSAAVNRSAPDAVHSAPNLDSHVNIGSQSGALAKKIQGSWIGPKIVTFYSDGSWGIQRHEKAPLDKEGRIWGISDNTLTRITPWFNISETIVQLDDHELVLRDKDGNIHRYTRL